MSIEYVNHSFGNPEALSFRTLKIKKEQEINFNNVFD